jgi:hypothetical protein
MFVIKELYECGSRKEPYCVCSRFLVGFCGRLN